VITGLSAGTLAEDGDPADVLALVEEPSFSGCLIIVRPIGMLNMIDQNQTDQKILAVPDRNPRYDDIHSLDEIYAHVRKEIEHFFTIYKELENRKTATLGWAGPDEARKVVTQARRRYLKRKKR
jgi:inorganic pyrophosphatase